MNVEVAPGFIIEESLSVPPPLQAAWLLEECQAERSAAVQFDSTLQTPLMHFQRLFIVLYQVGENDAKHHLVLTSKLAEIGKSGLNHGRVAGEAIEVSLKGEPAVLVDKAKGQLAAPSDLQSDAEDSDRRGETADTEPENGEFRGVHR